MVQSVLFFLENRTNVAPLQFLSPAILLGFIVHLLDRDLMLKAAAILTAGL